MAKNAPRNPLTRHLLLAIQNFCVFIFIDISAGYELKKNFYAYHLTTVNDIMTNDS